MKIAIGSDHNGLTLKNEIKKFLNNYYEVIDISEHSNITDDYPNYAFKIGDMINNQEVDLGILICGTGIGMCIAANKVEDIRCAHVSNTSEAALSKQHNNANIIAIRSKMNVNDAIKIIDIFINSEFSKEERHIRRNNLISKYEKGEYNV